METTLRIDIIAKTLIHLSDNYGEADYGVQYRVSIHQGRRGLTGS